MHQRTINIISTRHLYLYLFGELRCTMDDEENLGEAEARGHY